jgi:hypothetical protein
VTDWIIGMPHFLHHGIASHRILGQHRQDREMLMQGIGDDMAWSDCGSLP